MIRSNFLNFKFFSFIKQQLIVHPIEGSKFSLVTITTEKQVQDLINEYEPDIQLQQKGQISLHGLYQDNNKFFLQLLNYRFQKSIIIR